MIYENSYIRSQRIKPVTNQTYKQVIGKCSPNVVLKKCIFENMNEIEIYKSNNGETQIEVRFEKDTVWLNLNQISELFGRDKSVISRHLSNIFKEEELDKNSVVAKNATTAPDRKTYQVDY